MASGPNQSASTPGSTGRFGTRAITAGATTGGALATRPLSTRAIVEWLSRAASYREHPGEVTVIETHISWVFLTDRYAYKLKKPIRFDFLDYGTLDLRRAACEAEVRLNRRLARDVYLGVVPITQDAQGQLHLGEPGEPLEWLVQMRRLRADRTLEQLILSRQLTTHDVRAVAQTLGDFYAQAAPLTVRSDDYRRQVLAHVRANRAELLDPAHELPADAVRRVHAAQLSYLAREGALLDSRVCDGRIVEGHGDLRPEHIYLVPQPVVIDCLEFNRELRSLDVLDELGFLAMECQRLEADGVGQQIVEHYRELAGDHFPESLLTFYQCYRACVRAKVAVLRAAQLSPHNGSAAARCAAQRMALEYLRCAERLARGLGPGALIAVGGLMGTGKSTLAAALAETLGATILATDVVRQELGLVSDEPVAFGAGPYAPAARDRVYDELWRQAERLLADGQTLVVDASFLARAQRERARELGARWQVPTLFVHCECPREVALERLAARWREGRDPSQGRPELYDRQAALWEPDPPSQASLTLETREPLATLVAAVVARLATPAPALAGAGI